jgi:phospholipase C
MVELRRRMRRISIPAMVAVLAATSAIVLPIAADAAPVFADGFESGSFTAWTSAPRTAIETQSTHEGAFAARMTAAGSSTFVSKTLPSPQGDLYLLMWFRVISRSSSIGLVRFRAGGTTLVTASITSTGRLSTRNGISRAQLLSPAIVDTGGWHQLEMHIAIGGTAGRQDVWFDGAKVSSLSTTNDFGTAPITRMDIGDTATGRTFDLIVDDIRTATTFIDVSAPTAPTGLRATGASPTAMNLTWAASQDDFGVASYTVFRDTGSGPVQVGTPVATSFVDTGLEPATTYTYTVEAVDLVGNRSPTSVPAVGTTLNGNDSQAPSPPTDVLAQPVAFDEIALSWSPSQDNVAVASYAISRDDGSGSTQVGTSLTTDFLDRPLQPDSDYTYVIEALDAAGNRSLPSTAVTTHTPTRPTSPIEHVVIIFQENQSFDSVLGALCTQLASGQLTGHMPCDGASTGQISTGASVPLAQAPDLIPEVAHSVEAQRTAIDGGLMDGFSLINGCTQRTSYACYMRYDPAQIPNLSALAKRYVISDRTFEFATTPSWAGHLVLATADLDGFRGSQPNTSTFTTRTGPGWGCDSFRDTEWWNGTAFISVPSCVPDRNGNGPYRASPVANVPTLFDRLQSAGVSWNIYGGASTQTTSGAGYGWAICPTFYSCLGSGQRSHLIKNTNILTDAAAGTLPAFSIVTPTGPQSQHNGTSMLAGDNWIGQVMDAVTTGPQWSSTAVFITYDDCGCFYDHVPPPNASMGIRVPMVIASPYARPGYTDSNVATYASLLAFAEHTLGLAPLNAADASAYDYSGAFDFSQSTIAAPTMVHSAVDPAVRAFVKANPVDPNDPT